MADNSTETTPLYAVWLTEEEAMRILQIAEEQDILRSVWNKIKASAHTKKPQDRVRVFIRETEEINYGRKTHGHALHVPSYDCVDCHLDEATPITMELRKK